MRTGGCAWAEEAGLDLNFELEGMFALRNMKEYVRLTMYPGPPYPRGIAEVRVIYAPLVAGRETGKGREVVPLYADDGTCIAYVTE